MSGPFLLQHNAWLFICSLFGVAGYILVAVAASLYAKQKILPLAFVACLPEIVYGLTANGVVLDWLLPIFTVAAIMFLARCLLMHQSWHFGIECLLGCSCIAVVLVHLMVNDIGLWWAQQLATSIEQLTSQVDVSQQADVIAVYKWLPKVQTGYTAVLWLLFFPMCIVHFAKFYIQEIDANLLSKYQPGIMLGKVIAICGLVLFAVNFWLETDLLIDLMPIWLVGFMLVGLSSIHELARKQSKRHVILIATYVVLLIWSKVALPLVLVLGCLDCLFGLRYKLLDK
jgi:hypothetical protein